MRNIRKAALAGLTAVALVAGGTTAAAADENHADHCANLTVEQRKGDPDCMTNPLPDDVKNKNNSSNSSVWGDRYNGDNEVTGRDLLGWEKNFNQAPVWAQIWYVVTVLGVVGSVIGLVALPIFNDAKAKGFII